MATHTLIGSYSVNSGGATNVVFNSISQSYTDLRIIVSGKFVYSSNSHSGGIYFNSPASDTSYKNFQANGTSTGSSAGSSNTDGYLGEIPASNFTGWANLEVYIPNYTSSVQKTYSVDMVSENNGTANNMFMLVNTCSKTAPITSITLRDFAAGGANWAQYSNFYLYGIKNS